MNPPLGMFQNKRRQMSVVPCATSIGEEPRDSQSEIRCAWGEHLDSLVHTHRQTNNLSPHLRTRSETIFTGPQIVPLSAKWHISTAMSPSTPFSNPLDTVLLVGAFSTAILLLGFAWILSTNQEKCRNVFKFMWSCFVKPFSTSDSGWGGALEGFYSGQADVYDATRQGLLKGRTTMMRLAAAHLSTGSDRQEKGNLVWVDVN